MVTSDLIHKGSHGRFAMQVSVTEKVSPNTQESIHGRSHLIAVFVIKDSLSSIIWNFTSVLLIAAEVNKAAEKLGETICQTGNASCDKQQHHLLRKKCNEKFYVFKI